MSTACEIVSPLADNGLNVLSFIEAHAEVRHGPLSLNILNDEKYLKLQSLQHIITKICGYLVRYYGKNKRDLRC